MLDLLKLKFSFFLFDGLIFGIIIWLSCLYPDAASSDFIHVRCGSIGIQILYVWVFIAKISIEPINPSNRLIKCHFLSRLALKLHKIVFPLLIP